VGNKVSTAKLVSVRAGVQDFTILIKWQNADLSVALFCQASAWYDDSIRS